VILNLQKMWKPFDLEKNVRLLMRHQFVSM